MGRKIRDFRVAKNMTQEKLAELSGLSRRTIWALESGTAKNTTSKTLLKVAEALGTTVDQIFFDGDV